MALSKVISNKTNQTHLKHAECMPLLLPVIPAVKPKSTIYILNNNFKKISNFITPLYEI